MRQLRTSAARFEGMACQVPNAVFGYLKIVYTNEIEKRVKDLQSNYDAYRREDDLTKESHLRQFRPNLENPANKDATAALNKKEHERTEKLKDVSLLLTNGLDGRRHATVTSGHRARL